MFDMDQAAEPQLESFKLGQLAHVEMGQSPDSKYVVEDPSVGHPFLQGNSEFGAVSPKPKYGCLRPAKLCKTNDVLISVRAPVGAVNIADDDYCIGRGLAAIRVDVIKPSLLKEVMARNSSALRRVAQGTTFEAISKTDLLSLALTLPRQKDWSLLARILDTLDTAIHETEAIIAKLKAVKQGLLHDLLTRGVDAHGELRKPYAEAPQLYQSSPLGWIPKSWSVTSVDSLLSEPPRNGLYKPAQLIGRGALLIGQTAFTEDGSIAFDRARRAQIAPSELAAFGLRSGDLLVSRVFATLEGVGQPVVVPKLSEDAVYESNMMRLRVKQGVVSSTILFHLLKQPSARLLLRSHASLSNQASINRQGICSIKLPLPTWKEQLAIDERIGSLAAQFKCETAAFEKYQSQKLALMDDLLTGRVRVTPLLQGESTA